MNAFVINGRKWLLFDFLILETAFVFLNRDRLETIYHRKYGC